MPAEQLFVVTVARMMMCDEADVVAKWSGVVSENSLADLKLVDAAYLTTVKDFPGTNVRPMTVEEIDAYRATEKAED